MQTKVSSENRGKMSSSKHGSTYQQDARNEDHIAVQQAGIERFSAISILPSQGPSLQPKLSINQPNDKYEQEADRVADQVVGMSDQLIQRNESREVGVAANSVVNIQRKCAKCEEEEGMIQPKSMGNSGGVASAGLVNQIQTSRGGGQAMDAQTRSYMEPRFGMDFSGVRIHADGRAADMNRGINAKAFTIGRDIYFNQGAYQPDSREGKKLLAHELTHVVQQHSGFMLPSIQRQRDKSCPEVVATQSYSRGNNDWSECNYETAQLKVNLILDTCACSPKKTTSPLFNEGESFPQEEESTLKKEDFFNGDFLKGLNPAAEEKMPLSVEYEAILEGKTYSGRPGGELEGQASQIGSGKTTTGRSITRTPQGQPIEQPGMTLVDASDNSNTTGPLILTRDDNQNGGRAGDPGDKLTQRMVLSKAIDCDGEPFSGQVNLLAFNNVFQTIDFDIDADRLGALKASIALSEAPPGSTRVETPLRNLTAGEERYPTFPGILRPGSVDPCRCHPIIGAQYNPQFQSPEEFRVGCNTNNQTAPQVGPGQPSNTTEEDPTD